MRDLFIYKGLLMKRMSGKMLFKVLEHLDCSIQTI